MLQHQWTSKTCWVKEIRHERSMWGTRGPLTRVFLNRVGQETLGSWEALGLWALFPHLSTVPVPSSWSDCEDWVNEVWTYHTHLWSGLQALASINFMQDLTCRGYSTSRKSLSRIPEGQWIFINYPSIANGPLQALFISRGFPGRPFLHYGYLQDFFCVRKTALTWHWGSQPTNAGGERNSRTFSIWGMGLQQSSQKTTESENALCHWVGSTLCHMQNCNVLTWATVLRSQNCAPAALWSVRNASRMLWQEKLSWPLSLAPKETQSGLSQLSSSTQRVKHSQRGGCQFLSRDRGCLPHHSIPAHCSLTPVESVY